MRGTEGSTGTDPGSRSRQKSVGPKCSASVQIRCFSLPDDCNRCPCMRYECRTYDDPIGCVFTGHTYSRAAIGRPDDCPLVEVKSITEVLEEVLGDIESHMPDATYDEGDCGYLGGLATAADLVRWRIMEEEEKRAEHDDGES